MALYLGTNRVQVMEPNEGFVMGGRLIITKTYSFNLSQTNFSSLTPTTSAQNLTLFTTPYTATAGNSVTCYRVGADYETAPINAATFAYMIYYECVVNYAYSSSVADTIHGIRSAVARDWFCDHYQTIVSATGALNTTVTVGTGTGATYNNYLYQKANNTYAQYASTAYGIFPSGSGVASRQAATSSAAEYFNLIIPGIQVRANATYCPTAALGLIDPAQTTVTATWYIYEGDQTPYRRTIARSFELIAN